MKESDTCVAPEIVSIFALWSCSTCCCKSGSALSLMKTDRAVCCGQIGQVTARILNFLLPGTFEIFRSTWSGPHLPAAAWSLGVTGQGTVVPLTTFVTLAARCLVALCHAVA